MLKDRFEEGLSSLLCCVEPELPTVLLAVSGGMDSMCMAHLFKRFYGGEFAIATVNFSLRGAESDRDAAMVRSWAKDSNIKLFEKKVDTKEYASAKRISTQIAAREIRYEWFNELSDREGFRHIAIAHNLNDSVETLFINLIRGTGIDGLSGIRSRSGERIIRPLLSFTRREIEEYMTSHSVPYVNDSTNNENHYTRNRIRNLIFPVLEGINPSFLRTMERNIALFTEVGDIIETLSTKKELLKWSGDCASIDIQRVVSAPHSLFWLYNALRDYGFNCLQIKSMLESARNGNCGAMYYSDTHKLLIDRTAFLLEKRDQVSDESVMIDEIVIGGKEECSFKFLDKSISISFFDRSEDFIPFNTAGILYLDCDKFSFPLKCRRWFSGDRFIPLGMTGFKKLSDFYADIKIDRLSKDREPVLIDSSGQIVCLPAHRVDNRFKITDDSRTIMSVRCDILSH